MSRQEQNDRHIIWSDISLDLDDWRESLEELYPGYSDDELYDIMVKSNAENLYDERVNLNIQLSQPIIVIGDLGRWNGRVSGYKMIDSGNIKDCLYSDTDYTEWYVDKWRPSSRCRSSRRNKPLSIPCIQRRCYRYAD